MTTHAQRLVTAADPGRVDLRVVASFVDPGARVLDIGCGDGQLLKWLEEAKGVDGRGIELSQKGVNEAVARGVSVVQGDADRDLGNYPDGAFDFVILSQTLQATRHPRLVLEELLRIGRKAIVSFPNFGHWRIRWMLATGGRMPITHNLPCSWYDTPNIHFCTIRDFLALSDEVGARIEAAVGLHGDGRRIPASAPWRVWNLCAEQAIMVLSRRRG
jgi:methionine biosynthesis protein MetW